jgi:hypothetical protein
MKISIFLLIAIICLWIFGSYHPVVVVESSTVVNQDQKAKCPGCGGTGSVKAPVACPECRGTGKGDSLFKPKDNKSPFASRPNCVKCNGSGKITRPEKCPQCKGSGSVTVSASEAKKVKTARANLSLWEKILSALRIKPDANCRPQRMLRGSYPLVAKYIEITANPAYKVRVVKWARARLEGTEWIVGTTLEFTDKGGKLVRQDKEFIVENREVKGVRKEGRGQ